MDKLIAKNISYYLKIKYTDRVGLKEGDKDAGIMEFSPAVLKLDDAYILAYYKYPDINGELGKMKLTEENLKGLKEVYDADCVFVSYGYTLNDEYVTDDQVFGIDELLNESFVREEK